MRTFNNLLSFALSCLLLVSMQSCQDDVQPSREIIGNYTGTLTLYSSTNPDEFQEFEAEDLQIYETDKDVAVLEFNRTIPAIASTSLEGMITSSKTITIDKKNSVTDVQQIGQASINSDKKMTCIVKNGDTGFNIIMYSGDKL